MPAWSSGNPDDERIAWVLVHFIRTLPSLTPPQLEAMKKLNPRSPAHHDGAPAPPSSADGQAGHQ
jgi:hypothetical protein